ncbi:MAG: response regulator transcription factor [Thermoleophilia bacterium]|nr:response regulator transcription factor [Thermoleophilia bacterium]
MDTVLIADDHPLLRDLLTDVLEQHGFDVVGQASNGAEAITEAARLRPHLILLDLMMPDMDGLAALPRIRDASPDSAVVILSASGTDANVLGAIRSGASGFLLKSESAERIALLLRGVADGEAVLSGPIARLLLDQVRESNCGGDIPEKIARELSAREVEVLLLLDEHLGTDEIAARLYISEHTVRSHVKSMLRKLGVSSRRSALERLASARKWTAEAV